MPVHVASAMALWKRRTCWHAAARYLAGKQFDPDNVPFFVNRTKVSASDQPGMALWREYLYTFMRRNRDVKRSK